MSDETVQTPIARATFKKKQRAFLKAYQQLGHVSNACIAAGIARQNHYDWLKQVEGYAEAFEAAKQIAGDMLIDEARRRAHDGWEEPIVHQGEIVGTKTLFSDGLLMFLIKKHDPSYRDKLELTGKDGERLIPLAAVDALLRAE